MKTTSCCFVLALIMGLLMTAPAAAQNVAVYAADETIYRDDVVNKLLATGMFDTVDAYDAGTVTPTLTELSAYDAVLVYSNLDFADNQALGDVLADYVDAGGGLVLAVFAFWNETEGLGMSGRLSNEGYLPFTQDEQAAPGGLTMVVLDTGHPILTAVNSFEGGTSSYHNSNIAFAATAGQIAEWSNGQPLIGVLGSVAGLNFFPPSSDARDDFWNAETDGDLILANALLHVASTGSGPGPQPLAVPFASLPTLLLLALLLLTLSHRAMKKRV
jgi:hypothetical protein